MTADSKNPTSDTARQFFAAQGKQAGAAVLSDPNGGWTAVLTRETAECEYYYLYQHGNGNDQATGSFTLTTLTIGPMPQEVRGQDGPPDLAASANPCKDPPWLAGQFPSFKLAGCAFKPYATVDLDLPTGAREVAVHVLTTHYSISDAKQTPVALLVARNYETALRGLGARAVSDPARPPQPILTRTTPEGEFWYLYRQGSGNADAVGSYTLTTVQVAPLAREVEARDGSLPLEATPCQDPPWLARQFAYFKLDHCDVRDFDRIEVDLPAGAKLLEGRLLANHYSLTDPSKAPVALVMARNYSEALEQIGASLVSDPARHGQVVLTRATPQGTFWYIYSQGSGNDEEVGAYTLTTLLVGPMPQEVEVKDATAPIDISGTVCKPPPWLVRQFAYFRLDRCDVRDFDTVTLDLPDGKRMLSGQVIDDAFVQSDPSKDPVTFVLRQNYT
jgi:hypothetical protein